MSIETGTQVRIIRTDDPSDFARDEGYFDGNVGTVVEKNDRLARLSSDDEFTVRFPETTPGEGWFFTAVEEGTIWERA